MTQASIAAFALVAFAIIAAVASVMTKVHTDIVPGIKALVSDIRDIRAIATDARQTAALAAQQSDNNSLRLNGQSAKIDLVNSKVVDVNNSILLATPPPETTMPTADTMPPAVEPPPVVELPPPVVEPPQQRPINVTITADAPLNAAVIRAAHAALDAQAVPSNIPGADLDPNRADINQAVTGQAAQHPVFVPAPPDTPGAGQTATAGTVGPASVITASPPVLVGAATAPVIA